MSAAAKLVGVPGGRLAFQVWPGGGRRRGARRRAALGLGLALLLIAALAVLFATGAIRLPGAAAPGRHASPSAATSQPEPARAPARPSAGSRASARESDRVVAPRHAAALFAQHSWFVLQPAPPPAPPPPPPEPTAPPLPYVFVGSFAPAGEKPVFFLSRGDRVIDAHVGDRLDGVYELESAAGGQLVFVYLPLNVRQNLPAGAPK